MFYDGHLLKFDMLLRQTRRTWLLSLKQADNPIRNRFALNLPENLLQKLQTIMT